jgi:hypothetical protein
MLGLALLAGAAHAQAPPPSFFEGRSNEDLRALASDLHNDILLRRVAATRLVISLADQGDIDGADAAGRTFAKNIEPRALKHAQAVRLRRHVHVVAALGLGVVLGIALLSIGLGRGLLPEAVRALRRIAPAVAFFLVNAALVGGYLASSYENGSPVPFLWFAVLMIPLLATFRTWSAVGSPGLAARAGRGAAAVAATLALGFLVVEQVNPAYLEGFGL